MDVPGAGDDLNGLGLADVQLADPHMVGIGVTLQSDDLANHDVGDLSAHIGGALNLGAGEGHSLGKFLIIHLNGNKLVEPFTR